MAKKYMIQTSSDSENTNSGIVASEIASLSSAPGNTVQKVIKTKDKEITVLEVEDPKTINGLASKSGVIVEECQTMSIYDVNIKESWLQKIINFVLSLFFSIKTEDDSINNTADDFLDAGLGRYRINGFGSGDYNINSNLWNITTTRANEAWKYGYTGNEITVAILDTGLTAHKDLPNVLDGISTVGPGRPTSIVQDGHSHGTHVSSTIAASNINNTIQSIYGIAPKCKILPIKVLGTDGFGDSSDVVEGLIYAKDQGVSVINMSLGGGGYSQIFDNVLKECAEAGIIVVAATGNEARGVNYPAKYANTIPVGSHNQSNKISYFSNYGPELANGLVAPGEKIYGAGIHNDYIFKSGTSMATPAVTGAVALIKQRDKNATLDEVRKSLTEGAIKFKGVDTQYQGNGKLDVPNSLIVFNRIKREERIPEEVVVPVVEAPITKTNAKFYKQATGDLIRNFQIPLKELGLYNDSIDGIYGNNTASAIQQYTNGKQDFVGPIVYKNLTGQEWPELFSRALQITAEFEGTGYTKVVGDFDSAILTWGIIGFTLKHKELINLFIDIYDENPNFIKDSFKDKSQELIYLIERYKLNQDAGPFFEWGKNCNTPETDNDDVKEEYVKAFAELGKIPEVKQLQRDRAKEIYWDRALKWANDFKVSEELSLALCFDCAVQGFNSTGRQQVVALTEEARQEAVKKIQSASYTEAEKRKIIATANATTCNPRWKQDVWSRKSLFITGTEKSYVHGKAYTLSRWGLEY